MSDEMPTRVVEAQRLIESGEYDAATRLMVVLWREGTFHERTLSVRKLLPKLAALNAPAREAFTRLRDGLTPNLDQPPAYVRWIQLCHALDDGAPVVQWLQTVDLDAPTARIAVSDERVYRFAERAEALPSLARIIDVRRIEAGLRQELSALPAAARNEALVMNLVATLELPRRTLVAVGRTEDEARLAALIETLAVEFSDT
ncbi:MAG: hypothetical protein ACO1OB_03600 [Archangium sp.]